MNAKPLVVDFTGLKKMGWPFSRAHTWRLHQPTITITRSIPGSKRRAATVIPNPDPFPAPHKANAHWNSPPLWRVKEVLDYFEAHGLAVTQDWVSS